MWLDRMRLVTYRVHQIRVLRVNRLRVTWRWGLVLVQEIEIGLPGKRRKGAHQQNGRCCNLLHGQNVARSTAVRKCPKLPRQRRYRTRAAWIGTPGLRVRYENGIVLLAHFTVRAFYNDCRTALCGVVMVAMMAVMMLRGCKSRAGEHEDEEGCNDDLLHGKNLA
jgi:hypothetical protein